MTIHFRKVAIFAKRRPDFPATEIDRLRRLIEACGAEVMLDTAAATQLGEPAAGCTLEQIGTQADLVAVLGGDGTTLGVTRRMAEWNIPIIGINAGRLGFITDICMPAMERDIPEIIAGNCIEEHRTAVFGELIHEGNVIASSLAINEVAVSRSSHIGLVEYAIRVDGMPMGHQRADGILVATPTGSTAYALAAGGPILSPALQGIEIVPVAPHSLSDRPIVLSSDCTIEIEVVSQSSAATAAFDSQNFFPMKTGDILRATPMRNAFTLLHLTGYNHFATLRNKLGWGEMPRYDVPGSPRPQQ